MPTENVPNDAVDEDDWARCPPAEWAMRKHGPDVLNVLSLRCGHTFHVGCIKAHVLASRNRAVSPVCPVCRSTSGISREVLEDLGIERRPVARGRELEAVAALAAVSRAAMAAQLEARAASWVEAQRVRQEAAAEGEALLRTGPRNLLGMEEREIFAHLLRTPRNLLGTEERELFAHLGRTPQEQAGDRLLERHNRRRERQGAQRELQR